MKMPFAGSMKGRRFFEKEGDKREE